MKVSIDGPAFKQCLAIVEPIVGRGSVVDSSPTGLRITVNSKGLSVSGMDADRSMKVTAKIPKDLISGVADGSWLVYPKTLLAWSRLLSKDDHDAKVEISTTSGKTGGVIKYRQSKIKVFGLTEDRINNFTAPNNKPLAIPAPALLRGLDQAYGVASQNSDKSHVLSFTHLVTGPGGLWVEATDRAQFVRSLVLPREDMPEDAEDISVAIDQDSAQVISKIIRTSGESELKWWVFSGRVYLQVGQVNVVFTGTSNEYPDLAKNLPAEDSYKSVLDVDVAAWASAISEACVLGDVKRTRLHIEMDDKMVSMRTDSDQGSVNTVVEGAVWTHDPVHIEVRASSLRDRLTDSGQSTVRLGVPAPGGSLRVSSDGQDKYAAWVMPFQVEPLVARG